MLPDWTYYASGSNLPGEVRGFDDIGHPFGFTIPDLAPGAVDAAIRARAPVFIDSGAFGEKEFTDRGPVVVKPISHEEWVSRLAVMERVASARADVTVVAPDSIGDQDDTLRRLEKYRPHIKRIASAGVRVLVAIPRGRMSQSEFWRAALGVVGEAYRPVPAFPMKKAATTPRDLARFAVEMRPDEVHLLGMGPKSRGWQGAIEALGFAGCRRVTCDSVLIMANVGRTNGPDGGPRILTASQDVALEMLSSLGFEGDMVQAKKRLAIGLAFGKPVEHRDGGAEPDIQADLILVGCVAGKLAGRSPVPVRELYRSTLWGLRRRYAESRGVMWGVVSAGLGVVPCTAMATPYETKVSSIIGETRDDWVRMSRAAIRRILWPDGEPQVARIEVIAGAAYVALVREAVAGLPVGVSAPLAGMGIGDRQGWLKRQSRPDAPAAACIQAGQLSLFS